MATNLLIYAATRQYFLWAAAHLRYEGDRCGAALFAQASPHHAFARVLHLPGEVGADLGCIRTTARWFMPGKQMA